MKKILVIGGSKGIGQEIVKSLSEEAEVYAIARSEVFQQTNVKSFKVDITSENLPLDELPDQIDGLAYCPGSINLKPFRSFKKEEVLADWEVNYWGAFSAIQQVLPKLKKAEQSSIVLFSTVAVSQGLPFHASIASAKGAIEGLVRSLAAELAPKIRVNGIAPSLTDTGLAEKLLNSDKKRAASADRHPLRRIGNVEDMAKAAKYLLTDDSSWVSGQILSVDGGMSTLRI